MIDRLRRAIRPMRRLYLPVQDRIIRTIANLVHRGPFVREHILADDPLCTSTNCAIYVHHDKNGAVADYVVHQLSELVGAGYRITFVTNSPSFPAESCAQVSPLCKEIIWRFNSGYDFGAYKDGIASLAHPEKLSSLILMNDSTYGPFRSLRDVLSSIDRKETDVWGIVDSLENSYHLQTFFLMFFPPALRSPVLQDFWRRLPYVDHKMWVIRNAEVGLTQALQRACLRIGVLAPYLAVAATAKERLARQPPPTAELRKWSRFRARVMGTGTVNPTQFFWDVLISDYACPFIKRDLLSSNPNDIPSTSRWAELIAAQNNYDISLAQRHLSATRNNVPDSLV